MIRAAGLLGWFIPVGPEPGVGRLDHLLERRDPLGIEVGIAVDDRRDLCEGTRRAELRDRVAAHEMVGRHAEPGGERSQAVDIGLTACERRVNVEALTPASVATSFQVSRRERRWASIAACRAVTSKRLVRSSMRFHPCNSMVTSHILHVSNSTPSLKGVQTMASDQEVKKVGDDGKVEVTVNDKPVVLVGAKQTGASVKKAAIEQDVNIKEDFVLSIELGGGKTKLVGDDEEIEVYTGERFLAIENDDNS